MMSLLLALAGFSAAVVAAEPLNLSEAKAAVLRYAQSGEYTRDLGVVAGQARDWITMRAEKKLPDEKLAVVLDIDETALSNLEHMRELDFGYVPDRWDVWVAEHFAPAIGPVREVYRHARRLGVAVFFITGRREKDRSGTERNLRAAGYEDYERLFLMPDDADESTRVFKTAARRKLEGSGWTIIANLGDQQSDLAGGAAERTFKLPNPFYLIE